MIVATLTVNGTTYKLPFAAVMPPQSSEERERLKSDIRANGIRLPVVVTEDNEVLDGHHRLAIAAELGLTDIPVEVKAGMSGAQKLEYAESVNLHRRHLSREQVNAVIARRLAAEPERSDRDIASETGVDHKRVGRIRKATEATGATPQLTATKGKDGKTRRKRKTEPSREPAGGLVAPPCGEPAAPQHQDATASEPPAAPSVETPPATRSTGQKPWPALAREGFSLSRLGERLRILGGVSGKKRSHETLDLIESRVRRADALLADVRQLITVARAQLDAASDEAERQGGVA